MEPEEEPCGTAVREVYEEVSSSHTLTGGLPCVCIHVLLFEVGTDFKQPVTGFTPLMTIYPTILCTIPIHDNAVESRNFLFCRLVHFCCENCTARVWCGTPRDSDGGIYHNRVNAIKRKVFLNFHARTAMMITVTLCS